MSYHAQPEKSSSNKTVIIVVSIVAGAILLIVAVCGGLGYLVLNAVRPMMTQVQQIIQDAQVSMETAQTFLSYVSQGQLDRAYELTSDQFKKTMSAKEFKEFVAKHPEVNNSVSTVRNAGQGGPPMTQVAIPFTFTGPKGQVNGTLRLIKESDTWKVDQFTIP
jgi:hypothetical protein